MNKINKKLIHYDREADVLAVYIKKGQEEEFVEVAPDINVELDKKGSVIGIEILNASKVLQPILKSFKRRAPAYARYRKFCRFKSLSAPSGDFLT